MSGCSESQPTDSLREIAQGQVIGIEGNNNTYAWKGIPFAKPPLDDLRWKPPVEAITNSYNQLDPVIPTAKTN